MFGQLLCFAGKTASIYGVAYLNKLTAEEKADKAAKAMQLNKNDLKPNGRLMAVFQRVAKRHDAIMRDQGIVESRKFSNLSIEFFKKMDDVRQFLGGKHGDKFTVYLEYVGSFEKTTYFRFIVTDKTTQKVVYDFSIHNLN